MRTFDRLLTSEERAGLNESTFLDQSAVGVTAIGVYCKMPIPRQLPVKRLYLVTHYHGGGTIEMDAKIQFHTGNGSLLAEFPANLSTAINVAASSIAAATTAGGSNDTLFVRFADLALDLYVLPFGLITSADQVQINVTRLVQSAAGLRFYLGINNVG